MLMPVQLPESGVDPRGRRYTAEEREHAYLTWRVVGRRSLAATAELLGVARTLPLPRRATASTRTGSA